MTAASTLHLGERERVAVLRRVGWARRSMDWLAPDAGRAGLDEGGKQMTDAEIKNLRDLMRAATPGPLTVMARNAGEQCVAVVNQLELVPPNGVELAHEKADADFLAAVVNALPGLLDEIERLRRDGFDSRHPAAQNLLGRNARLSIALDIVRDILADDCEPTPITAEHWAPIHDQVQSVIRKRNELREEVERLRDELETERMRL